MHVEILVEEPSAKIALEKLLPRLLPGGDTYRCVLHRGKDQLLSELPARLQAYAQRLPREPDLRVVILMDADQDCYKAKTRLEKLVAEARLVSKTTAAPSQPFRVLTRLTVSELEAWFLGDRAAISAAYPRVHAHHFKGTYQDSDRVPDTWETLHRILQKGGYYSARYFKVEIAERIAQQMSLRVNTSASFHTFCAGLAALR